MLSRWLLFLVASGQAFFIGVAFLMVGVGLGRLVHRRGVRTPRDLLVVGGVLLIGVAAPPWPLASYLVLGMITIVWLVGETCGVRWVDALRGLMVIAWLGAGLAEGSYQIVPTLPPLGHPTLGIIGDSVTAGTDDADLSTWPSRLANRHQIDVRNHAVAGATVRSAIRQAVECGAGESLIVLEIGGNDLLGATRTQEFQAGLAQLIKTVRQPGRTVMMLELPLIPGLNQYCLIQRRMAAHYHVVLIPKRILAGVLLGDGATLDSVHLSPAGHDQMAAAIWAVIRPAYQE